MRGSRMWRGSTVALLGALLCTGSVAGQTPSPPPDPSPASSPSAAEDTRCEDLGLVDETVTAAAMLGTGATTAGTQPDDAGATCLLAPWTKAAWPLRSAFPGGWFVSDPEGDSPEAGTDIVGVGFAPVRIPKGGLRKAFADDERVTVVGKTKKASDGWLVRLFTKGAPAPVAGENPSWTLATDRDGDPADNVPVSIAAPDHPFANTQNAVHLLFQQNGDPFVGVTDFAGKLVNGSPYYNDTADVAVATLPDGVAFLIPAGRMGAHMRLMSAVAGQVDLVSLPADGAQVPLDGRVPATLGCTERAVTHEQFVVNEVIIAGDRYQDVPFPSSTSVGDCKRLSEREAAALERVTEDVMVRVTMRDPEGVTIEQYLPVDWWTVDDRLYLVFDIGLTKYGRMVVTSVAFDDTGSRTVDDLLDDNAAYLEWRLAPLEVDQEQGPIGADDCVPARPA